MRERDAVGARQLEVHAHDGTRCARPTTRSITSSRVYAVVSTCTAPSGITSGAAARPESIRSRSRSDCSVADEVGAAQLGGAARGAGRRVGGQEDLHLGVGARPRSRCRGPRPRCRRAPMICALQVQQAGPHLGDRADRQTAALTSSLRIATATSSPSTWMVGASGSVPDSMPRLVARARRPRPGRGRRRRARSIHQVIARNMRAGVEVAQAEPVGDASARCSTCPSPEGPSMATTSRCVLRRGALTRRAAYRCVTQPRDSRASTRCSAPLLLDDQLDEADGAAGVVVDADVLDVDADLAGVGEQPGQLARVVGHGDEDRRRRPHRAAVLAGDRVGAGRPRARAAPPARRSPPASAAMQPSSGPAAPSAGRSTASALAATICCHSTGSPAAIRVTSRTPCPDSARCSPGASASRAGRQGGQQVRQVGGAGDRLVVLLGGQPHRHGAAQRGQRLDQRRPPPGRTPRAA